MSADLLAAFGENPWTEDDLEPNGRDTFEEPHTKTPKGLFDDSFSQHQPPQVLQTGKEREDSLWQSDRNGNDVLFDADGEEAGGADDGDEFGEFEDVIDQTHTLGKSALAEKGSGYEKQQQQRPVHSRVQEGTLIDLLSLDDGGTAEAWAHAAPPLTDARPVPQTSTGAVYTKNATQATAMDVFEDDGWGDFEAIIPQEGPVPSPTAPPTHSLSTLPKGASDKHRHAPPPERNAPPSADPELDDDWAVFEDGQTDPPPSSEPIVAASTAKSTISQPKTSNNQVPAPPPSRPSNIPPPSILLSLLPTTFQSLLTAILQETPSPHPTSPTASSPPPSLALSSQIINLHATAARITAGRTLRWKRDSILAQSTRISAARGGGGGMKLASVSKGEGVREEQALEEMVGVWNGSVRIWQRGMAGKGQGGGRGVEGKRVVGGKGRGSIGAVGLKLSKGMIVKSMSGRLGVMEAGLVCALCGLKRSERVVGVDDSEGVEDVFGEFWMEGWGHRDCVGWWEGWKGELEQR